MASTFYVYLPYGYLPSTSAFKNVRPKYKYMSTMCSSQLLEKVHMEAFLTQTTNQQSRDFQPPCM